MRSLLLLGLLTVGCVEASDARRYAVRLPEDASSELAEAVRGGAFNRWVVPNREEIELVVGPRSQTSGDVEVTAQLLPADNVTRAFFSSLPVHLENETIYIAGTAYGDDPRHALAVRLPEAAKPSWVVVGRSVEAVASLVDQVLATAAGVHFRGAPDEFDYLLRENPWTVRSGRWRVGEDGKVVAEDTRDDFVVRDQTYAAMRTIRRASVVLRVPAENAGSPEMRSLADALDEAAKEIAARIPIAVEKPVEIVVERDFVAQGRHLGDIGPAVVEEVSGAIHLVYHPRDLFAYRFELARTLLRRQSERLPLWLEHGAALWLSRDWYGRRFEDWIVTFVIADVLPSAEEILADEHQGDSSEVLWPPVSAAMIERLDGETLREKLRTVPDAGTAAKLLRGLGVPTPKRPRGKRAAADGGGFRKGISFAMANGLESGYHAPGVDDQLERLRQLGADSVSLMPFAYQRRPDEPRLSFLNRHPSSETDVGVIHAARRAHVHGLRVLWKPHIWVSHDSWPGEIEMTGAADWKAWWRSYRRYVLHHAVLAEWTDSELFSIGVELGRTVSHESEWRRLIGAVRGVYSGKLTYSGNWAGDYEQVGFWDVLDFVGVDAYFPLSDRDDADRAALAEGARRTAATLRAAAERFGKPVLLTEVGFAAREGAWIEPHQEGGTLSEAHQTMAYEALLDALGHPSWLAGVYLWKVFSHPDGEGHGRPDFRFLGRGAEDVVRGYFRPRSEPRLSSQR
ncbi:MAG: hypothetical protein V3T72_08650 [Thermoanaerobaculia bacterium]